MDGKNGKIRVRFGVDGSEDTIKVSSVVDVLESAPPPQQAGAGGRKRKRT